MKQKPIDIVDVKALVRSGRLTAFVNNQGNIILKDQLTTESVIIGRDERGLKLED